MRYFLSIIVALSISPLGLAEKDKTNSPATMLVVGRIWTADDRHPWAEAVAVRDDKIAAVGMRDELDRYRGEKTRVIDAGTGMVVPGMIDSHIHLIDGGLQLASVQLRGAASRDEFVRRIGEYAKKQAKGGVDHGR